MTKSSQPVLVQKLEGAVKQASWLTPADEAQVEIARLLALRLAASFDHKEIVDLSKTLTEVLRSLGLNIAGRTGKAEAEMGVSPLDEIKKRNSVRLSNTTARKQATKSSKPRSGSSGTS